MSVTLLYVLRSRLEGTALTHLAIIIDLNLLPRPTITLSRVRALLHVNLRCSLYRSDVRPASDDPHRCINTRRPRLAFSLSSRSFVIVRHVRLRDRVPEDEGRSLSLPCLYFRADSSAIHPLGDPDLDLDAPDDPSDLGQPIDPLCDRFHPTSRLEDLCIQRYPALVVLPDTHHSVVIKVRRGLFGEAVIVVVLPGESGEVPDTGGGESEELV